MGCHRNVLAATSPVFARMLKSGFRESTEQRIDIGESQPGAVQAMVKFIYTGELESKDEDMVPLLKLADRYDIQALALICVERALLKLDANNVVDVVRAARAFSGKEGFNDCWLKICNAVRDDQKLHTAAMHGL